MSDVLELPALAEAMTGRDLRAHVKAIRDVIGMEAYVSANVSVRDHWVEPCILSVYPNGICGGVEPTYFRAPTWPEAITAAMAFATSYAPRQRETTIRKMALVIIDIADEHVTVTAALLRGRGFSADDIAAHHEAACARASEMCGNAPFVVVM